MRKYQAGQDRKLTQVVCNRCGRKLKVEDGYLKEGCFSAEASFGYFSRKDGICHSFDLCEDCYDALTESFQIPVEVKNETEFV